MIRPFDLEAQLQSMEILVDTREQPSRAFKERVKAFECPAIRHKLDFGDYSLKFTNLDGNEVLLDKLVAIERKMDGNELALCFGRERARFESEFQRAQEVGARMYLLVESEDWESLYEGRYGSDIRFRSKLNPKSMIGSLHTFAARYDVKIYFVKPSMTGRLIADILKYELKNYLEKEDKES